MKIPKKNELKEKIQKLYKFIFDNPKEKWKPFWKKQYFLLLVIILLFTSYIIYNILTKEEQKVDEVKKITKQYEFQLPISKFQDFITNNSWNILKITQPENNFFSYLEVVIDVRQWTINWITLTDTWSISKDDTTKIIKFYKNVNQDWKDINVDFNNNIFKEKLGVWFYDSNLYIKKNLATFSNLINIIFTILILRIILFSFWRMWNLWGGISVKRMLLKWDKNDWSAFDEIGGIVSQKNELYEIVENFKNWKKFEAEWIRKIRWIMFFWPSWVGKTMIAKAIANDSWIDFFSITAGDFRNAFIWQSAKNVKNNIQFVKAFIKKHKKDLGILFIDEIDSVLKKRWSSHSEDSTVVNAFLAEMDGIEWHSNIIIIGASNYYPEELDSAAMSRFDKKLYFNLPSLEERIDIINKLFLSYKKNDIKDRIDIDNIDVRSLAQKMVWASWRDIDNVINEARRKAASKDIKLTNDLLHEEYAIFRIWPNQKGITMNEDEKRLTAYHELWHAYIWKLAGKNPETITIIPRWPALWITWILETKDKYSYNSSDMINEIRYLLWGRMAEKLFLGDVWTWASNDYMRVNKIAVDYFIKYDFAYNQDRIWIIAEKTSDLSGENRKLLDELVRKIITEQEQYVFEKLKEYTVNIEKSFILLMEKEIIHNEDIYIS